MSKGRNLSKLEVTETGGVSSNALSSILDAAPAQLDTLNELAAALGDDANFASTVTASLATKADTSTVTASLATKQATLVSGTNIKTINGTSILGSGNIVTPDTGATNIDGLSDAKTLGTSSIFLGSLSGQLASTDYGNIGIGYQSLYGSLSNGQNIGIGVYSLKSLTGGGSNIAIGWSAGENIGNPNYNVLIGQSSLASATNSYQNMAIGAFTLQYINATVGRNVAIGYAAGRNYSGGGLLTSASSSIFIGDEAYAGANTTTNEIVIGASAVGAGSNTTTIGNASTTKSIIRGKVTTPEQPHIFGSPTNTGGSGFANSFAVQTSQGGLSWGGDRITVPVAGLYLVTFNTICSSTTGRVDTRLYINGSYSISQLNEDNGTGYHYRSTSNIIKLGSYDYIQFSSNNWYDATFTGYSEWRSASVTLIG